MNNFERWFGSRLDHTEQTLAQIFVRDCDSVLLSPTRNKQQPGPEHMGEVNLQVSILVKFEPASDRKVLHRR